MNSDIQYHVMTSNVKYAYVTTILELCPEDP